MEKAWAKLYGNYSNITAGFPEESLHDLTGAPIYKFSLARENTPERIDKFWSRLRTATKKVYPMVVTSQNGSDTQQNEEGISFGHAYTFLRAI